MLLSHVQKVWSSNNGLAAKPNAEFIVWSLEHLHKFVMCAALAIMFLYNSLRALTKASGVITGLVLY